MSTPRPRALGELSDGSGTHVGLRAVVADTHHLARGGLVRALEAAGIAVVAEETSGERVLRSTALLAPDVLVVGLEVGGIERGHVVAIARDRWPNLAIVTLSDDEDAQLRAWQLGASAHLSLLSATQEQVVATVEQAVAAPSAFLGEDLLALRRSSGGSGPRLTPRETEVLHLAGEGLSVAAISRRLFITDATTKSHLSGIYRKLGVSTRASAVLAAERLGMLR